MNLEAVDGKKIALGVCGGIAAYKVVEVARRLTKAGADVHVVMTPSAMNFVGPITFSTLTGNPVRTELFPESAPSQIPHTDLGRTADLVVIAPATANIIARHAQGLSGDLMTALLLSAKGQIVMAPAMHTEMWQNASTRENITTLAGRGVRFIGPVAGALAGPDEGMGRLSDVDDILQAVAEECECGASLEGVRLLVTAGGTREPIDAVRYIGNRSSGLMGIEICHEALRRGAKVTLVVGPTHLPLPEGAEVVKVVTAAEMSLAVLSVSAEAQVVIMAAAVADWSVRVQAEHKLKKSSGPPEILLEPTLDILVGLEKIRHAGQVLVGFCAETDDLIANARAKLVAKGVDLIVGNLVGVLDSGFDVSTNRAVIVDKERADELPLMSKRQLARTILDRVALLV
ncbi:MAG: bifunctional phosphopantothenoylcysteine decarboxylase/phosphopantothenate--cysteine ligase CoaBC [Actinomycetota bacterium]